MNPFISIIIPVYNGEQGFIKECLESVWKQDLEPDQFEVICVDDCSTDGSLAFLEREKNDHKNMKVCKTERNVRQGGARNLGIKVSRGEFIMFIDQDDYFSDDALLHVFKKLKSSELDILVCDSAWQVRGRESRDLQHNFKFKEVMVGDDFLLKNGIPYAPWKFVISRDFFYSRDLFFEEGVRIEDVDWALRMVHFAEKIQYLPVLLIHYNRGVGSTTWDGYKDFQTISDTAKMARRVLFLSETLFSGNSLASEKVGEIADFYFNHALRFMFGVNGNFATKKACLIENIPKGHVSNFSLVKLAHLSPGIFSLLTIVGCPFFRILLSLYRKAKY